MNPSVQTHAVRILLSLYAFEAAMLLLLVGVYKAPALDWALLSDKAGTALIGGGIGLIASGWYLIRMTMASGSSRGKALALGVTTNTLTLLLAFALSEVTVRVLARTTPQGIAVGSMMLQPTWSELKSRSQEVLSGVAPWGTWDTSYFVYDSELGWTVGGNRRSPDGLYFSSVEGIRSAAPNMRMLDETYRNRVALIGDSNAFSFEVPFEQSWGYHLEQLLGDDTQVLNFGVDGYGIDQVYLRYQRDVRPWKPKVVLIGFIDHDLWRSMAVYPFLSFRWPGYLVKPRFLIRQGELELLNAPLPAPNEVLGVGRVQQLPFIDYDLGYGSEDWLWRFEHAPLIFRFLTSAYPRWPRVNPRFSREATAELNSRLFIELVKSIERNDAVPLVVFLEESTSALVKETLSRARIPFLEVNQCLADIPVHRRKVPSGHHYTGFANEAIARCTASVVKLALTAAGDPG